MQHETRREAGFLLGSGGPMPPFNLSWRDTRRCCLGGETSHARVIALTALAMVAFACNSLLCRVALNDTGIDAASFTTIRLASGAAVLWLIARVGSGRPPGTGNWLSAVALFVYAAGFSFAYISLPASTGALLLFGAVQVTMIGHGIWAGERFLRLQLVGLALALGGLVVLLSPGLTAPPLSGSLLMLGAGFAWGIYSLRGKGAGDPIKVTAGNFLRAAPVAAVLSLWTMDGASLDGAGFWYAVASGALTSGIGYAIWYAALPALKATNAATAQLSVPVIAALGGIAFLGESATLRLVLASIAILGGIALVILKVQPEPGRGSTGSMGNRQTVVDPE
jgi:drug/metabolite transporter (DMT)-like permease